MFGRRKKDVLDEPGHDESVELDPLVEDGGDGDHGADEPRRGPFDESEVDGAGGRLDLGSIWLRAEHDMEVRLELDQRTDEVSAVQVSLADSTVQLQVFAAPRSSGIWEEIRGEISEMIAGNRGTVEEASGPFGPELRTRLPQVGQDGRTLFAPAIFAGVDGPRWFLRAVYSGQAAVDEGARAAVDEVVAACVVARGHDPRAPREMLPLRMPEADPR